MAPVGEIGATRWLFIGVVFNFQMFLWICRKTTRTFCNLHGKLIFPGFLSNQCGNGKRLGSVQAALPCRITRLVLEAEPLNCQHHRTQAQKCFLFPVANTRFSQKAKLSLRLVFSVPRLSFFRGTVCVPSLENTGNAQGVRILQVGALEFGREQGSTAARLR